MSNRMLAGVFSLLFVSVCAQAATQQYLIRFRNADSSELQKFKERNGGRLELVSREGNLYKWTSDQTYNLTWDANVQYVQNNHEISLLQNPSIVNQREELLQAFEDLADDPGLPGGDGGGLPDLMGGGGKDNPDIKAPVNEASGADPLLDKEWGIKMVGADLAWKKTPQGKDIVVAVTDTGMDYNHQDLINNVWHNKAEIADNKIDDDKNGFVDDVIGWDFAAKDNKPFDMTVGLLEIILKGGNPGHGTHVSGVVGARLNNSVGIGGVAPQVKIMPVRIINQSGKGDDAAAIAGIDYAVKNGANIINASWGGEKGDDNDKALTEAIERAEKKGVIFVAAAGNGRMDPKTMKSGGFDNDSDKKPMIPASLPLKNIVAVAAIDSKEQLAPFSNWGAKSVKLGAPGVKVLSTVPGNKYQDTVLNLGPLKATWDGTSMAAPFVAGALAVVWSTDRTMSYDKVIDKLLSQTTSAASLKDKVATGGRLELKKLGQ